MFRGKRRGQRRSCARQRPHCWTTRGWSSALNVSPRVRVPVPAPRKVCAAQAWPSERRPRWLSICHTPSRGSFSGGTGRACRAQTRVCMSHLPAGRQVGQRDPKAQPRCAPEREGWQSVHAADASSREWGRGVRAHTLVQETGCRGLTVPKARQHGLLDMARHTQP